MHLIFKSNFLDNIEHSDDTVTATASEHVSRIAEVQTEAGSAQILDLSAWLEHLLAVEYLDFVGACTTCDDQVTRSLLELSRVNHARLLRWHSVIPADGLDRVSSAEVPKLKLFVGGMRAREEITIVYIDGVTTYVWRINRSYWTSRVTHIPDHDRFVPTA